MKKPRVVWMSPPCTTQRSQQSQSRSSTNEHLVRGKNSFTVAEHLNVSGVASLMVCFLQNPGSSSAHIDVGQIDLLCSRRCFHDHSSNVGEGNVAIHTAVGQLTDCQKRSFRVESSKQIRSQTCCSVTIDSKNHLVAPAVSTDDCPVIQEDAGH